nr:energy transducer TonB [Pseudomonas insulae]
MNAEQRRRAYLSAMQVVAWLPRVALPFAAPSRPETLQPVEVEVELAPVAAPLEPVAAPEPVAPAAPAVAAVAAERPSAELARAALVSPPAKPALVADSPEAEAAPAPVERQAPPRFALQLLRAGACLLLVELPTGEPFQSRDPAYLLLKDLLRAAGLPSSPQLVGEPVRWPLMKRGSLDQGPQAALEYVQGFVAAQLEQEPSVCLWLVGLPAVRFAGEADAEAFNRELQVDGLGLAWALPGLELLMDEPERKAELWRAMRRTMRRWNTVNE